MSRIANRQIEDDFRYRDVLSEWREDLRNPDQDAKVRFKDMYLKHANVIGSTCSSTGSPGFQKDYLSTFLGLTKEQRYKEKIIKSIPGIQDYRYVPVNNSMLAKAEISFLIFEKNRGKCFMEKY